MKLKETLRMSQNKQEKKNKNKNVCYWEVGETEGKMKKEKHGKKRNKEEKCKNKSEQKKK